MLSDYKKLMELLGNSNVPVFQRVKSEVENTIREFTAKLFKNVLVDTTKPFEEIHTTIRYDIYVIYLY